jgi:hypothetical protein
MDVSYLGILQFQIYDWINMIIVIKIMLTKIMTKEEKGVIVKIDPLTYIRAQKVIRIVFIFVAVLS